MTAPPPAPAPPAFASRLQQVAGAFQESKIVLCAVELGLFDRLAKSSATAAELARDLRATERGVRILADALVSTGYLALSEGRYRNQPDVDALLVTGRPGSLAHIMAHRNHVFRSWAQLDEIVRNGQSQPERDKATLADPVANRHFILGMAEASRGRVGPLLDRLPLERARRFVDLGGGPGHYACEAARRHPGLRAVVVDLPLTIEVAREHIASEGLSDRVDTRVCDFYREPALDFGGPADIVLVSQVLHAEGEAQNRELCAKIAACLSPGAIVAVAENTVDATRTAPVAAALFAVNMLAGTERGRTYSAEEIAGWLADAGLEPEEPVRVADRSTLVVGVRRA